MRHGKKIHKLERPKAHREALMSNLATALITHKRIKTTEAKAKALKPVVDKLITTAKQNTVSAIRLVAKTIRNREILKKLFDEIAPEMMERTSGYSRIMRVGQRRGDGAEVVMIELVTESIEDSEQRKTKSKKNLKKVQTRSKVESKKAAPAPEAETAEEETAAEAEAEAQEATEEDSAGESEEKKPE